MGGDVVNLEHGARQQQLLCVLLGEAHLRQGIEVLAGVEVAVLDAELHRYDVVVEGEPLVPKALQDLKLDLARVCDARKRCAQTSELTSGEEPPHAATRGLCIYWSLKLWVS